jgi:TonB family protein
MLRSCFLVGLLLVCISAYAQVPLSADNLYKGGQEAFSNAMNNQLRYPQASVNTGRTGVSVVSFRLDQRGAPSSVTILNSVDPYIDEAVTRALQSTSGNWITGTLNSQQDLVLPVVFARSMQSLENIRVPANVLKPLVVAGQEPGIAEIPNLRTDLSLAMQQVNRFMANFQSDLAMLMLNELVRTNPFNKEIRETRIYVAGIMNNQELARSDRQFVERFLVTGMDEEQE